MISKQSSSIIVIALSLVYAAKPPVTKHQQINKLQGRSTQPTVKWQSTPDLAISKGSMPRKSVYKHRDLNQVKSTKSKTSLSKSTSKSTTSKSCKSTSGSSQSTSKSERKSSTKGSKSAADKSAGSTKKSSKSATTLPCSESSSPSSSPTLSPTEDTENPSTSPSVSQSGKRSSTESPSQIQSAGPSQQDIEYEGSMAPSIQPSVREEDRNDYPSAARPSHSHSATPSMSPSVSPDEASSTSAPVSQAPSSGPSAVPSPTVSLAPSVSPSPEEEFPTATPSNADSASPSTFPSISPSEVPPTDNDELETALPSQEPSSSLSVSMAPSIRPGVEEDEDTQVLSDPPSAASISFTDYPSQEPAPLLDAIKVCRCNEDNVCIGGKLTKVMELLRLCFFAPDEQTIASVNNLRLNQPSLYSADILIDDAEISHQVERTCDDSRQTCVVTTPVDAAFFVSEVPPPLMAQGTVVSTLRKESRKLRGSRRVEQVVMAFSVVVELEKMTMRSFDEMGTPMNSDAESVQKLWWVIGICFFCLNIGVAALVINWDTIKMKRQGRQLGQGPPLAALGI